MNKQRLWVRVCSLFLIWVLLVEPASACTIMVVGKDASDDGSVIVSHTNDGLGDPRMVYIPAMDHPEGSRRAVYYTHVSLGYKPEYGASQTARLNTKQFGPAYDHPGIPESVPLGHIPQVSHTYAYYDAAYAVMNEHQLIMGECTDKAKVHPQPAPGKRIFYSTELSRVAMERCKTAREAIKLMGALIDTYGYYGTGETLAIGDPNEGWVMEMCGYDMDGTGGVWVAKRVADDEFFIAANQFRIRDIVKDKPDEMMYSANIFKIAEEKGWWSPKDGPLDFMKVYGDGEFHHPYYSKRRVWRGMSIVAPSLKLSPWVDGPFSRAYAFSIKPDNKLGVRDILRVCRDNYEGTEFDLTKGLAAGPFGNPNRFEGDAEAVADKEGQLSSVKGYFERPLNIYRCVYYHVVQARGDRPAGVGGVAWFAPDRAANSCVIPIYAGAGAVPSELANGSILKFDRDTLWTANNYVANQIMIKYSYMYPELDALRNQIVAKLEAERQDVEAKAIALYKGGDAQAAQETLADFSAAQSKTILAAWWKLSEDLFIKYDDGYLNTKKAIAQPLFYPSWWLKDVGYEKKNPDSYAEPTTDK